MSREPYEPYEVSLGNTQIAAFVALLALAIVAAFAAGSWWGQSRAADLAAAPDGAPAPAAPSLPAAEQPAAGASLASPVAPAEVVRFFGGETDDEDGAASEEAAAAGDETVANGDGAAAGDPIPAAANALVVQVFSSADLEQAASVERRLRADGHRAFLSPQTLDGQVMQRVRVGPFDGQAAAAAAAEQLAKQYGLETWITPNN